MKLIKRLITIAVCLVLLLLGAAVWTAMRAGEQGDTEIERWIGGQIIGIVDARLNPKLSFDALDYQYPATVRAKHLKLTTDDPRTDAKLDFIAAEEAIITLSDIPHVGQPIAFERIAFNRPVVRLVRSDDGKGMAGFSNMVKRDGAVTRPATTQSIQEKLGEVLTIRRIELIDGRIEYDPRIAGTEPMILDQITALLEVHPQSDGNYRVQSSLGRKPLVDSSVQGLFDLNTMQFRDAKLKLSADIAEEKLEFMPPQLRAVLTKHAAQGRLSIDATGDLPLTDPSAARVKASVKLAAAHYRIADFVFPVKALDCELRLADGYLEIDKLSLAAMEGDAVLTGGIRLGARRETGLDVQFNDILLQELLAEHAQNESSLCGRLSGRIRLDAPVGVLGAKLRAAGDPAAASPLAAEPWPAHWGSGDIRLQEACLVRVPLINRVNQALAEASKLVTGQGTPGRNEKLHVVFELRDDRIHFEEIQYVGDVLAGGGDGYVTLDRQLNLSLRGGPVERVADLLGRRMGALVGTVTDAVAMYRVRGTVSEPQVTVEVAPAVFGGVERLSDMLRGRSPEKKGGG